MKVTLSVIRSVEYEIEVEIEDKNDADYFDIDDEDYLEDLCEDREMNGTVEIIDQNFDVKIIGKEFGNISFEKYWDFVSEKSEDGEQDFYKHCINSCENREMALKISDEFCEMYDACDFHYDNLKDIFIHLTTKYRKYLENYQSEYYLKRYYEEELCIDM